MEVPLLILVLLGLFVVGFGVVLGIIVARSAGSGVSVEENRRLIEQAARQLSVETVDTLRSEQHEQLQLAMETVVSMASNTLGGQLAIGKEVLQRERSSVDEQVASISNQLEQVTDLVAGLGRERAEQAGRFETGLQQAMQATAALTSTTKSLSETLASPKSRGQWGERMAEDVLRAAGFVEGTNYEKQTKASGGGIPDFTFPLPSGQLVHMDVKFPIDNYRRYLEADEGQRDSLAAQFREDVRQRIKERGERSYIDAASTVDYVLLFVPNESVYGFAHEHDADLLDYALRQKVVLCSPSTLFAVLAVIRQSIDHFMVERRSHEILDALGALRSEWAKWQEPLEKMGRALKSADNAYEDLTGRRRRAFERQLETLESYRGDPPVDAGEGEQSEQFQAVVEGPAELASDAVEELPRQRRFSVA
jgi:DNA recombination protein RmuC